MFAALEARLRAVWSDLTTEVRADLEDELAKAKDAEARLLPMIQTAEADLKAAVAAAEPGVAKAVEDRAGTLVADVMALLGAPTAM